jgi:hypothetical protein
MCCIVPYNVYIFAIHSSMLKIEVDKRKFYMRCNEIEN